MSLASLKMKVLPIVLLMILLLISSFFIFTIGNPTENNINNDTNFEISSSYIITDKNQRFSDVMARRTSFVSSAVTDLPWSFEQHAYWLNLKIKNNSEEVKKLVSHFDNSMLDDLKIFQVDQNNSVINQVQLGDHQESLPFNQRITPHYSFEIAANSESNLYIRIATTGISNTPIHVYQQVKFSQLVQKMHLLWGVFIGVLVIIGLYNLVLYFSVMDRVYLTYNAYILSCLALMGIVTGGGFYIFPIQFQLFLNHHVIAVNCLMTIFVLLFLVQFLKVHIHRLWYYWLAMGTIVVVSTLLIVSLWLPEYITAQIFFLLMPCIYVVCFTLIITKIKDGLQWGKLYIYSWFPLLLGGAIQPMVLTDVIEYSFLSHHAFMIGVLLEIVLMAMALADRMRFQREQTIFNATHEIKSCLPNLSLLKSAINDLLISEKEFAVCLINIENYHSLLPYLEHEQLQKLESEVVNNISPILNLDQSAFVISTFNNRKQKIAKAKDGGLAFIIESTDQILITSLLNKIQSLILTELQISGLLIKMNTEIGVCFSLQNDKSITSASLLIQRSLLAIAQNKEKGKNLYFYHHLEKFNIKEHLSLARDLQTAIRENQLHLYHQPQVDLDNNRIYGSEVLLRWNHPEHGSIGPDIFIPIAEDTGLINELTRWVIECAFKQYQQLYVSQYTDHKISINISGKDVSQADFLTYVQDKIAEFKMPNNTVIFELTESVMISDYDGLRRLMNDLSQLGIILSIDDYGTGYSSLSYISQLKFDEIKIDKIFISDLDKSARNLTIVKTTIDMAKNLNLKIVAEGVESFPVVQRLKENGCHIVQGYYYSKPLPFEDYLIWLKNYNR
jgi:EAL domain-containing protein (putative c-di-GMP-specific phosphodiesterase class I)